MDIPVTLLTRDDYTKRVNRVVELQRRWSGWMQSANGNATQSKRDVPRHRAPTSSWQFRTEVDTSHPPPRPATAFTRPSSAVSRLRSSTSAAPVDRTINAHDDEVEPLEVRWSQFGISVTEVSSLKGICDALKALSVTQTSVVPSQTMSVELAVSALEAAAKVFEGHPLIGYFLEVMSQWIPKGVYANPFPLMAEAEPLPTLTSSSAGDPDCRSFATWLLCRAKQWSTVAVPLGTVSSVFDVGRKKCLPLESEATAAQVGLQSLGNRLFGDASPPGPASSAVPPTEATIILSRHFSSWRAFSNQVHRLHKCLAVCGKSARKSIVEHAFFKWKCETMVSLAERKSSHAERLHFVVEDYEKKQILFSREKRDLQRERDTALNRVDSLLNESKLALHKVKDMSNGMVWDFRRPIFAFTRSHGIGASREPMSSGTITFQRHQANVESPFLYYSYDCGVEFPVEGMAAPNSESFKSFYRLSVTDTSVAPSKAHDPLLRWVNDEVLSFCQSTCDLSNETSSKKSSFRTNTKFPPAALGELGVSFLAFVDEWRQIESEWNRSVGELKQLQDGSNTCIPTVKDKLAMSCHIRRSQDLKAFPFVYIVLIYRMCPRLFMLHYRSPKGENPASDVESRVASLLMKPVGLEDVFHYLEAIGVVQHVSLAQLLGEDASGGATNATCDAAHRLILSRLYCYSYLRFDFESFWKISGVAAAFNRCIRLQDMVTMRSGENFKSEETAAEILVWVKGLLRTPILEQCYESIDNVSENFGEGLELIAIVVKRIALKYDKPLEDGSSLNKSQPSFSEKLAFRMCETARIHFECHVPEVVYERLHLAEPTIKLIFLTSLYNRFEKRHVDVDPPLLAVDAAKLSCDVSSSRRFPLVSSSLAISFMRQVAGITEAEAHTVLTSIVDTNDILFSIFLKYSTLSADVVDRGSLALSPDSQQYFVRDFLASLVKLEDLGKIACDVNLFSSIQSLPQRCTALLARTEAIPVQLVFLHEFGAWLFVLVWLLPLQVFAATVTTCHDRITAALRTLRTWVEGPMLPQLAVVDAGTIRSTLLPSILSSRTQQLIELFSRYAKSSDGERRWGNADNSIITLASFHQFHGDFAILEPSQVDVSRSPIGEFLAKLKLFSTANSKARSAKKRGSAGKVHLAERKALQPAVEVAGYPHPTPIPLRNATVAFLLSASIRDCSFPTSQRFDGTVVDFQGFCEVLSLLANNAFPQSYISIPSRQAAFLDHLCSRLLQN